MRHIVIGDSRFFFGGMMKKQNRIRCLFDGFISGRVRKATTEAEEETLASGRQRKLCHVFRETDDVMAEGLGRKPGRCRSSTDC
jgi:hypothetical protein